MNTLLIPHNDDEVLYCSYLLEYVRPLKVVIVFDGTTHEARFGKERGVAVRRSESCEALKLYGLEPEFLGFPDRTPLPKRLILEGRVFAPLKQGGNIDHDALSEYGDIWYSTYTKDSFIPKGQLPVIPNHRLKREALQCYKSQHGINAPIFDAVYNVPEFLNL